jgi:hypothetical protein
MPPTLLKSKRYPLFFRVFLETRVNISVLLAGRWFSIKEVDDGVWLVRLLLYELGYFDLKQKALQHLDKPTGYEVVGCVSGTMRLGTGHMKASASPRRIELLFQSWEHRVRGTR